MVSYLDEYKNNGIVQRIYLKTKPCDDRDYERFFEINANDENYLYELRSKRALQCIDSDEIPIRGSNEINGLQFNVDFIPCWPDPAIGKKCKKQTLAELQEHLTHPELIILSNTQRLDLNKYNDEVLIYESKLYTQHVNKLQANWMQSLVVNNELQDSISYLNLGGVENRKFFTYEAGLMGLSYVDDFDGQYYKVAGFSIMRSLNYVITTRSVYDFLSLLGDVGGLEAFIFLVFGSVVA